MKPINPSLVVSLLTVAFATFAARAESIRLADGTVLEGELGAPSEVSIKTAEGERRVAFSQLSAEAQKSVWAKWTLAGQGAEAAAAAPQLAAALAGPAVEEALSALASEVNLETWEHIAAIGSFRDKPEKRGAGASW
jgi:hypothetical protein